MIKTVKISNFKSVQDLEIELGRLNVFIGENGCGKTSILEGIAMGGLAGQGKLDEGFLLTRGVRVVAPEVLVSCFNDASKAEILVEFVTNLGEFIKNNIRYSAPEKKLVSFLNIGGGDIIPDLLGLDNPEVVNVFVREMQSSDSDLFKMNLDLNTSEFQSRLSKAMGEAISKLINNSSIKKDEGTVSKFMTSLSASDFLVYAPENFFLRRFEEESQTRPLGTRGEGLFSHLVELSKESPDTFAAIADHLSLIDWYGGFSIPNDLQFTERRIAITDRFIADTIKDFDQRSANEGFLYLLFYFTLFLSKWTPKFFAIDNVDNALNPRLCAKLVEVLAKLAKEQDKQAILTTHNPAILDGLDLHDDEQRLFVIYRNMDGATKARRIKPLKTEEGTTPVRNSEAFIRGYFGGLPSNF